MDNSSHMGTKNDYKHIIKNSLLIGPAGSSRKYNWFEDRENFIINFR